MVSIAQNNGTYRVRRGRRGRRNGILRPQVKWLRRARALSALGPLTTSRVGIVILTHQLLALSDVMFLWNPWFGIQSRCKYCRRCLYLPGFMCAYIILHAIDQMYLFMTVRMRVPLAGTACSKAHFPEMCFFLKVLCLLLSPKHTLSRKAHLYTTTE